MIYGFGKRILFGSDQMVWPEATAQAIARFRTAPYLSDAQRRDILFNNAVRLFGWTDLADCGKAGG
jgi:predicted TIM-barrel fold metal-dependent hydrolase